MRLPLVIGKKSDAARAPAESVERLLNGYVESVPTGKEPTPVYGTPGLTVWASGLNGPIRGEMEMVGVAYAVAGTKLYSFTSNGTPTVLGAIPNSDLVGMAGDGTNIVMVTQGSIYVWTQAGGVVLVVDPDAPAAGSVIWTDSYFLFGQKNTQQFFISALANPINYAALDFASAEWKPDVIVTPILLHRTVYLMGAKTIEAQQNTGGVDFPFTRYNDILIDCGLVGRDAAVSNNDTLFWLANDLTARRLDGLTATVISTAAIGRIFKGWADASLTVATAHVWDNHLFVVFRNPDGCVVFDQSTNLWHERASDASNTWRVRHSMDCYGLTLLGSATEGTIYKLDAGAFDEAGSVLPFEVIPPYAYAANKRFTTSELEIVAQMGAGSLTLNPMVTVEATRDGQTWGTRKSRRMGRTGERTGRVVFGPFDQARAMTFRIRITDPVQRAILGLYAEIEPEA